MPLLKRLRLGSVLAYLLAGVVIGPFGLRVFREPEHILRVAELGVVMFLFIIGLEMRPRRLWTCAGRSSAPGFCRWSSAALRSPL